MDIWIRSQNKDILMKVDNLLIDSEKNVIFTHKFINNKEVTYTLGKYKTKERALEVLNEIESIYNFTLINDTYEHADLYIKTLMLPRFYNMPKE